MNYRHAYHAGNFADVMKHVVLTRIIDHLRRKETPFRIIDTHAGPGLYDLAGSQAERTGEWRGGVGRLAAPFAPDVEALLGPYRDVLARTQHHHGASTYPGSPAIIREMLREQDRALVIERHPEDCEALKRNFVTASRVKVVHLDGWMALRSLLPPKERRGLVLIDPPYEEPGELEHAAAALVRAWSKWRTGIFALWYPIKDTRPVDQIDRRLSQSIAAGILRLELRIDEPATPLRLVGCGLAVINPPYTLAEQSRTLLPALAARLSVAGRGTFRIQSADPGGRKPNP